MADTSAQRLLDDVLGFARDFAGSRVHIAIKTNLGPEFEVGTADLAGSNGGAGADAGGGGGLASILGLKAAVILRNDAGKIVATYGEPPATDPVKLILLAALAGVAVWLIVRGLRA